MMIFLGMNSCENTSGLTVLSKNIVFYNKSSSFLHLKYEDDCYLIHPHDRSVEISMKFHRVKNPYSWNILYSCTAINFHTLFDLSAYDPENYLSKSSVKCNFQLCALGYCYALKEYWDLANNEFSIMPNGSDNWNIDFMNEKQKSIFTPILNFIRIKMEQS